MFKAKQFLHGSFQMIEVFTARVGFITHHHAGPLLVAHCVGATVCQQVNINIFRI